MCLSLYPKDITDGSESCHGSREGKRLFDEVGEQLVLFYLNRFSADYHKVTFKEEHGFLMRDAVFRENLGFFSLEFYCLSFHWEMCFR